MEKTQRCNNKDINTTIGFCLLPSELIQNILLHLCIPEIIRMKLVNKYVLTTISDQSFIRQLNDGSRDDTWIFVYTRRWRRDSGVLHGFSDRSVRWFKIPVAGDIFPGEDLYLLTASGNFLLFASNTHSGIVAVDLVGKTVTRIKPCPLGPRGTSSWRRSGMKLVPDPSCSSQFRFMFAEIVNNRPVLFTYHSNTATWQTKEVDDTNTTILDFKNHKSNVFLSLSNKPHESVVMCVGDGLMVNRSPTILRPRMNLTAMRECPSSVGFSRNELESQLLHIHGDEYKVVIRLDTIGLTNMKKMKSLEIWEISSNGENWELVSKAPSHVISEKPRGVMMGCLERRLGVIRVALMTNHECLWDVIWLDYDKEKNKWEWVPLPDCRFLQGSNMAGISFSSGLTFSL